MVEISYFIALGFLVLPALDYFVGLRVLPDVVPSGEKDEKSSVGADGVSVIIACHNEASNIKRKVLEITSQLQLSGVELFEIIVVDDGSSDDSVNILQILESKEIIKLIKVEFRKGKPHAINLGVSASSFPVLLFSDVLLDRLLDVDVGAVSSQLELTGNISPARRWMNNLKLRESNKGSTTGVCGALYVIKKELIEELPEDTILDDLLISLFVMKKGKRVVLEPKAIVHDVPFDQFYSGRRQGRITAGLIQLLRHNFSTVRRIGLVQLIFLYGQKYLKYTAPILYAIASVIALFSEQITMWHYSVTVVIATILTLSSPLFVAQALKLVSSYMLQLLKLDKYTKVKWDK